MSKTRAKEFGVALREGDANAVRAAKCREGYLRLEWLGDRPVAVYADLCRAVIARNALGDAGLFAEAGLVPIEAVE